ncbi:hypothetical protein D3C81_1024770 [compost metagenome]
MLRQAPGQPAFIPVQRRSGRGPLGDHLAAINPIGILANMGGAQVAFIFDVDKLSSDDPAKTVILRRFHSTQEVVTQPVGVGGIIACEAGRVRRLHRLDDHGRRGCIRDRPAASGVNGILATRQTR